MYAFTLALGVVLILGALALRFWWVWRYPWPFQGWRRDPVGTLLTGVFRIAMFIGGVYLIVWSVAHPT
jgi:hypothetical protein